MVRKRHPIVCKNRYVNTPHRRISHVETNDVGIVREVPTHPHRQSPAFEDPRNDFTPITQNEQ